jgi:hypothetical protein
MLRIKCTSTFSRHIGANGLRAISGEIALSPPRSWWSCWLEWLDLQSIEKVPPPAMGRRRQGSRRDRRCSRHLCATTIEARIVMVISEDRTMTLWVTSILAAVASSLSAPPRRCATTLWVGMPVESDKNATTESFQSRANHLCFTFRHDRFHISPE